MKDTQNVVLVGNRLFMKFPSHEYMQQRLTEINATIISTAGMQHHQILETVADAVAIVVIGHPITEEIIHAASACRFIMTLSVGYDVVDTVAATARGIPVSNCPVYCSEEVADHAITLLVSTARKIHELVPHVRGGGWDYKQARPITSFSSSTVGIIGLGAIGRHTARKAQGLGMKVLAYDPYIRDDIFQMTGVTRVYDLPDLLATTDYLTIHCPLTDETWHMIDRDALQLMQPHGILVNTARGPIVDQTALEDALQRGQIAGAGIDVLETEPPVGNEPILTLSSAIVTPHIAWYSEESHERNLTQAMDELVAVLQGHRPRYVVNPHIFSRRTGR